MSTLDRYDVDDTYIGPCGACGHDICVDPMLGEKLRHVGNTVVCEDCYLEITEDVAAWDRDMDERGYE